MLTERTIKDVAHELQRNLTTNPKRHTALLIGAGCSVSAGIPLAKDFVTLIEKKFPTEFNRVPGENRDYPNCMGALSFADRHQLICEFVDNAKINWAHIAIAQLMKHGFVDRILTTNFDPLAVRACALVHVFPAVYDMAVRPKFRPALVRDLAVFHLHGQRDGFVQLHKREDVEELKEALGPVVLDTAQNRTWIVAGYSGFNDPVFEKLSELPEFDHRLFWVGYKDNEPELHIKKSILDARKDAYWIKGVDADNFFCTVSR